MIRVDILTGRFAPGQKLRFADLTDIYGASTTVVREGLTRLSELGLVVAHPQQGFQVTPLSVADLVDLTTARCDIEELALRYAIAHGDLRWESDLVAACHTLAAHRRALVDECDPGVIARISIAWAAAAWVSLGAVRRVPQPAPVAFASSMRDAASYRPWMPPLDRTVDPTLEHIACAEAALARDAEVGGGTAASARTRDGGPHDRRFSSARVHPRPDSFDKLKRPSETTGWPHVKGDPMDNEQSWERQVGRRQFIVMGGGAALAALLAACGDDDDDDASATTAPSATGATGDHRRQAPPLAAPTGTRPPRRKRTPPSSVVAAATAPQDRLHRTADRPARRVRRGQRRSSSPASRSSWPTAS